MVDSAKKASSKKGAHVFLTGATGFLGKVVLEEMMRQKDALGVAKVYVLIRPKRNQDPEDRFLQGVAKSPCFEKLDQGWTDAVEVVEGDLGKDQCGIAPKALSALQGKITHVINCAASVEFNLPIADAAHANITSALNVLELARGCKSLEIMVAVSTAYVTPFKAGPVVNEVLAPLPRPAGAIYGAILGSVCDEKRLLAESGHPNTYTFTKAVAEHILTERKGDVPLKIVRPSIISASLQYPRPGWVDSRAAFAGFVTLIGTGHMRVVATDAETQLDIVPVDEVSERILDAAFEGVDNGPAIRHAAAGKENSVDIGTICRLIEDYYRRYLVMKKPKVVPQKDGLELKMREMTNHIAPAAVAKSWFQMTGNKTMAKRVGKLAERLVYLNTAFPYFTHNTFEFQCHKPLDAKRFVPHDYITTVCSGVYENLLGGSEREVPVGGRNHTPPTSDLRWSMEAHEGNPTLRAFGMLVKKVARRCTDSITFDRPAFEAARAQIPEDHLITLVPMHRSYTDFLLWSYLFFTEPELGIAVPHIAAADDFRSIPLIGSVFKQSRAFYIKRGLKKPDPALQEQITRLAATGQTVQFFIEGTRSRSGQFLKPKRGLLRCLQQTGKKFAILPLAVTYDRLPEEQTFLREINGGEKPKMRLRSVMKWGVELMRGKVDLGRIHLTCGSPILMDSKTDVRRLSVEIMSELQSSTPCTEYHLACFLEQSKLQNIDVAWLRSALEERGAMVVESPFKHPEDMNPELELCMRYNWMHFFFADAKALFGDHPAVANHIARNDYGVKPTHDVKKAIRDPKVQQVVEKIFEPICVDYARVVDALNRGRPQVQSAVEVLEMHPTAHVPYLEGALEDLKARDILATNTTGKYVWGDLARDLKTHRQKVLERLVTDVDLASLERKNEENDGSQDNGRRRLS